MFSEMSVSHSVQGVPCPFQGVGYFWSHVLSGGRVSLIHVLSEGFGYPEGVVYLGARVSWGSTSGGGISRG